MNETRTRDPGRDDKTKKRDHSRAAAGFRWNGKASVLLGLGVACFAICVALQLRVAESESEPPPLLERPESESESGTDETDETAGDVKALWRVIRSGDLEGVRDLVEAKPELALATDKRGKTALHIASRHVEIATYLLGKGSDANAKDDVFEETPLHWAVRANRPAVVRELIKFGARVGEKSKKGDTALSIARRLRMKRLITILEDAARRDRPKPEEPESPESDEESER